MPVVSIPVALLTRRLTALAQHLPAALRGTVAAVHQARVASRRLREALPVLGPPAGQRALRTATKRSRTITRALGAVRELDVSLMLLDELAAARPADAAAIGVVRRLVAAERLYRRRRCASTMAAKTVRVTLDAVDSVVRRVGDVHDDAWRQRAQARVRGRAEDVRAAIDDAGSLFDAPRLHAVRIAAKKLRYALELLAEARVASAGRAVKVLKGAQDQLGRLHDLQVLLVFARAPDLAAARQRQALDALRDHLERECLAEHGRYLAHRQRLLGVADRMGEIRATRRRAPRAARRATGQRRSTVS